MTNVYYQLQTPISTTGASCSGVEGSGRTYTLPVATATYYGMSILLQGSPLTYGVDYTVTGQVITFNVYVADSMILYINYYTVTTVVTSGVGYTLPSYVQEYLQSSTAFSSSTTPTEDTINRWIAECSREIDLLTNNTFVSTVFSSIDVDYDGSGILRLPYNPIQTLEIMYNERLINDSSTSYILLEEGAGKNYILYADEGEVVFINGNTATNHVVPSQGMKRFKISGTYGTSTVPYNIQKLCTLMVAKQVILSLINSQANSEGGAISVGTISISDPSMFSINYIKHLNDEIELLKKNIKIGFDVVRVTRIY